MNKRLIKSLVIIFTIASCFLLLFESVKLIFRNGTNRPSGVYEDEISYQMDPDTLLTSLQRGESNPFRLIPATPEVYSPKNSGSFSWNQMDYLTIANAIHKSAWSENLQNWKLYGAEFLIYQCQDNFGGFDYAHFDYFQRQETTYHVHGITITPLYSEISIGETVYDYISKWKSIDLAKVKISADDSLKMAEEYGGEQARLSAGNDDCRMRLILAPYKLGWRWSVYYFKHNSEIFDISIDPCTGNYKVMVTPQ